MFTKVVPSHSVVWTFGACRDVPVVMRFLTHTEVGPLYYTPEHCGNRREASTVWRRLILAVSRR